MVSDNLLDFVFQGEGSWFLLRNDNISAVYLCPAAGRGMQYIGHEFASGTLKTHSLYSVFPEDVEKTHSFFFLFKSSCLVRTLPQFYIYYFSLSFSKYGSS